MFFREHKSFYKNISILTLGNITANLISILALIVLTRLYSPQDFGIASVYISILSIATVISSLRLNVAIPIPKSDQDGFSLLISCILLSTFVSVLIAIFLNLYPEYFVSLIYQPSLENFLWMIPLGIFFGSIYNSLQFWATRKERFKDIAYTNVSRSFFGSITQIILGIYIFGPFGLILGHMIYACIGIYKLGKPIIKIKNISFPNINKLKKVLYEYKKFPVFSFPESIFNTLGQYIPFIIIASFAGSEAGFLFIAIRIMSMPVTLIGRSISQVYLSEARNKIEHGELHKFTKSVLLQLAKYCLPIFVLIALTAPVLMGYILGSDWSRVGIIMALIAPWHFFQIVSSPISMLLHVTGHQINALLMQFFGFFIVNHLGSLKYAAFINIRGWVFFINF